MKVGFVGVGAMGTPMARLLMPVHTVTAYDPDRSRVEQLVSEGALAAEDAAGAAHGADAVIVMVATPGQLDQAMFGPGGVSEGLGPGKLVILMSSVGVEAVVKVADRLTEAGAKVVDAPVTGGVARAVTGDLTILAGAAPDVLAEATPVLELLAANVAHCGTRVGDGQAVKLVNQLLCSVHLVAAAEALAFAGSLGLDPERVLKTIEGGAASSFMLSDRGPRMLDGANAPVLSAVDIFVKDSSLVLAAAAKANATTPLTEKAHEIFTAAKEHGLGRADDSAVINIYKEVNV